MNTPLDWFELDPLEQARAHRIVRAGPTPDFFEGMLLGNGDVGVCVTTRPDGLVLNMGKNDVWDIRHSEEFIHDVMPFHDFVAMVERISARHKAAHPDAIDWMEGVQQDPEYLDYVRRASAGYRKPWPHPWPCGQCTIHWNPLQVIIEQQSLDIADGCLTLRLRVDGEAATMSIFVAREQHLLWVEMQAGAGQEANLPVRDIVFRPHQDRASAMPLAALSFQATDAAVQVAVYQRLPVTAPVDGSVENAPPAEQDASFALSACIAGRWHVVEAHEEQFCMRPQGERFSRLCIALASSGQSGEPATAARQTLLEAWQVGSEVARAASAEAWARHWRASAVALDDHELEGIWYLNQYWLACCLKPGAVAPGLFGNWMAGSIGTAWHGDYHLNYNTQQMYWGVFASNHVEQHEPYVDLCWRLLPMAQAFARDHFGLPGAYYPHSAYPIPSQVNPYPCPPWCYQIGETAWAVQSLWWHYLYTGDMRFLREGAYPILSEAARFYAAYLRAEADGYYHVFPTVSPEMYGITLDFRYNRDAIVDLALIRFLLNACVQAATLLECDEQERTTWATIAGRLAPYPTATDTHGTIWIDVADGPVNPIYNVPATLVPVFPAEQVGLDASPDMLEVARRTATSIQLEGGNDLVFQPLVRARLGMLDFDWFLREVRYCRIANGTCTDRVRQVGGRYSDRTNFDFMARMGIWVENFGLPAVINECLMQSYRGAIRLFPNPGRLRRASFRQLRAAGGFLVSAGYEDGRVGSIRITSLAGQPCAIVLPHAAAALRVHDADSGLEVEVSYSARAASFDTTAECSYRVTVVYDRA